MRKKTKRKVWSTDINPILHAMEGAAITGGSKLQDLQRKELLNIDAFARGVAREWEWHEVNCMVGTCRLLAEAKIGPEALEACERAEAHLREDYERFQKTGKMGTTGPGLQAFRDVYEYYNLQRTSISLSEYEKHLLRAINLVKSQKP